MSGCCLRSDPRPLGPRKRTAIRPNHHHHRAVFPGGPADNVTRYIANQLGKTWNQQVVVENRTGAGGMIGPGRGPPRSDGYHLVLLVTGHHHARHAGEHAYRMPQDFTGITVVNRAPKLVVVHLGSVASFAELIEKVKQEPGKYGSYGTSGVGSMAHLSMELVNKLAGTKFVHIPTRRRRHCRRTWWPDGCPSGCWTWARCCRTQAGSLKVLAVTSDTRSPLFPDVPTIAEVIPNFQATEWFGIAGPKGVPPAIADKLVPPSRRRSAPRRPVRATSRDWAGSCRRPRP